MTISDPAGPASQTSREAPRGFDAVETWCSTWTTPSIRPSTICGARSTRGCVTIFSGLLNITPEQAFATQKDYYRRYGTSLRGLMIEHGIDAHAFLDHVHDVDLTNLSPRPGWRRPSRGCPAPSWSIPTAPSAMP